MLSTAPAQSSKHLTLHTLTVTFLEFKTRGLKAQFAQKAFSAIAKNIFFCKGCTRETTQIVTFKSVEPFQKGNQVIHRLSCEHELLLSLSSSSVNHFKNYRPGHLSAWINMNIGGSRDTYLISVLQFKCSDLLSKNKPELSELSVYQIFGVCATMFACVYIAQPSMHMRSAMLICACVHAWLLSKCAIWLLHSATMQTVERRYMLYEYWSWNQAYLEMLLPCGSPAPVWSQSQLPACTCSSSASSAWFSLPCPYLSTETGDGQMEADTGREVWWEDTLLWWETSFCWAMSHELWRGQI